MEREREREIKLEITISLSLHLSLSMSFFLPPPPSLPLSLFSHTYSLSSFISLPFSPNTSSGSVSALQLCHYLPPSLFFSPLFSPSLLLCLSISLPNALSLRISLFTPSLSLYFSLSMPLFFPPSLPLQLHLFVPPTLLLSLKFSLLSFLSLPFSPTSFSLPIPSLPPPSLCLPLSLTLLSYNTCLDEWLILNSIHLPMIKIISS